VEPPTADALVGGRVQFGATAKNAEGAVVPEVAFTWTSSNTAVATVDQAGLATAVGEGTAVINASAGSIEGTGGELTVNAAGGTLAGRVIDAESQSGIANATVRFHDVVHADLLGETTTSADGSFSSPVLTTPVNVVAGAPNYVSATLFEALPPETGTTILDPIPLVHVSSSPGGILGRVRNARDNSDVVGATVQLQEGLTDGSRSPIASSATNANGEFEFVGLPAGSYTLRAEANGFIPGTRTGIVLGRNLTLNGQDVIVSPTTANEIRIVLTWGSRPSDLDAHLTGANPSPAAGRFHVYYNDRGSLTGPPFAALDLDDVSSFGPETITITQFTSEYRFSVHDYTNRTASSSSALAASGAKVQVYYGDGGIRTFNVPNLAGTLWGVFRITGTMDSPEFHIDNTMTYHSDPDNVSVIGRPVASRPKAQVR
jgi:hypothetical protein